MYSTICRLNAGKGIKVKKVLQVVSCLELGGTEAFIMNQYRCMDRSVIQFDFFVFREKDYPYLEEIRSLGGNIIFGIPPKSTHLVRFLRLAVRIMREGKYCAVHSHVNLTNAWVLLAARIAGIPVRISHSHDMSGKGGNPLKRLYRAFELWILKHCATDYLACSTDAGCYLYGEQFFRKKGQVICNGIDVDRFLREDRDAVQSLRGSFSIPDDCSLVIGNITRFEPKKNQLFMIEVFRAVLQRQPEAILILGGPDGGLLHEAMAFAESSGIGDRIRFIGCRSDVPDCLHLFDVVLFPSQFEGLPIALLEAQAAGCRCVVSAAVSREADMGLGAMSFIDLNESPEVWADEILRLGRREDILDKDRIQTAFHTRGFDVNQSARELMERYIND